MNLRYSDADVLVDGIVRTSSSQVYAIDVEGVSAYLRTDLSEDLEAINLLIQRASEMIERRSGRAMLTATFRATYSFWPKLATGSPSRVIELPRSPLVSVTSVQYYDTDDVLQTIATTNYIVCTDPEPGMVYLKSSYDLPETSTRPDAVTITFTAGYGNAPRDVPASLRQAMLLICREENPNGNPNAQAGSDMKAAESIIDSFKVGGWTS